MANNTTNIGVSLNFTAQTGQAKASIQELQTLLNKIAAEGTGIGSKAATKMSQDIKDASNAAIELQNHLNNAFNVKTGKFDLSLFDKSLKSSGDNITNLTNQLLKSGDVGQQAFVKLAQSISLADQPMFKINSKLQDFASSLKKTMSWQLSNNVIRGFMGAIQTAYGYAQDLNASLTDIRIVTGKSTDEMARFAEQANKAAKALSTTTTDYTKGSLIYFQQGLSDQEVSERTETTIKMANVTGESTSKIADQMTAVWNNFADGSKELSYYADVMTALGAATASSSDEISEGINKFAATAKTVGLSYEYATAALATVTARTRESADVVGNAFKTLFARIQGLSQGDTLDDGTTLNKYSSALMKVGVNIKTASGELKGMDGIIDELGPKWQTLADDQKMALAQTVAGVRQYSQFMALMNNYDYFKENVSVAEESTGTLQKQADIYAESWEAASKRVRASAESLYQDLIDDKFFISINNGIANVLSGLDAFIDKAGGLKTVIAALGGVFLSTFANKIPDALKNIKYNFDVITGGSQKAYQNIINEVNAASQKSFREYKDSNGKSGINENSSMGLSIKLTNQLSAATTRYHQVEDSLSDSEKQRLQTSLAILQNTKEEIETTAKRNEEIRKSLELEEKRLKEKDISKMMNKSTQSGLNSAEEASQYLSDKYQEQKRHSQKNRNKAYEAAQDASADFYDQLNISRKGIGQKYNSMRQEILKYYSQGDFNAESIKGIKVFNDKDFDLQSSNTGMGVMIDSMKKIAQSSIDSSDKIKVFKNQLQALKSTIPEAVLQTTELDKQFNKMANIKDPAKLVDSIDELTDKLKKASIPAQKFKDIIRSWDGKNIDELDEKFEELLSQEEQVSIKARNYKGQVESLSFEHIFTGVDAFAALGGSLVSSVAGIQMVGSAFQSLVNSDLNGWEKLTAVLSGTIGGISILKNGITQIMPLYETFIGAGLQEAAMSKVNNTLRSKAILMYGKETVARLSLKAAVIAQTTADEKQVEAELLEYITSKKIAEGKKAQALAHTLSKAAIDKENLSLTQQIALMAIAHPIITAVVAAVAVLGGVVINKVIPSYENANKAISEANQKFEESKTAVEELEESLKDINKQIDELNNKDQLSLTDKQDLKNLQAQRAQLEAQLKLKQQIFNIDQKNQANTVSKNWSKSTKQPQLPLMQKDYYVQNEDGIYLSKSGTTYFQYAKDVGYDVATGLFSGENKTTDDLSTITKNIEELQKQVAQNISAFSEDYQNQEQNYLYLLEAVQNGNYAWTDEEKERYQADLQRSRKYVYTLDPQGYNDTFLKPIFEQINPSELNSELSNFDTTISDALGVSAEEFKAFYQNGIAAAQNKLGKFDLDISGLNGKQLYTLIQNLDLINGEDFGNIEELQTYLDKISINSDTVSQVHQLREDIESLVSITGDLNIGDILSEDDYNLLVQYNKELEKYFMYAGTKNGKAQYKYIGGADEELDKLGVEEQVQQMRKDYAIYQASQGFKIGDQTYDWMSATVDNINPETLKNLANSKNIDWSTFADGKTWTKENIVEMANNLTDSDEETVKEAKQKATLFLDTFKETISTGSLNGVNEQEEFQYLNKDTLNELDEFHDKIGNVEAYSKALRLMARGYDENSDAAIKYEEALDNLGENGLENLQKKLKKTGKSLQTLDDNEKNFLKAQSDLTKEIKKAEWDKFTEKALKYAQALKDTKDVDKQLRGIQKAFKDTKGIEVSMDTLKKYKDLFIEWGEAGEEASDDTATQLEAIINAENSYADASANGMEAIWERYKKAMEQAFELDGIEDQAASKFSNITDLYEDMVRIISENKPQVDIEGNADFSNAIAEMQAAGYTAADIATALAAYGQIQMTFTADGSQLPLMGDGSLNSIINLIQAIMGWQGTLSAEGNVEDIAKSVKNKFGGGVGGGRHSTPTSSSGGGGGSKSTSHADTKSFSDKDRYHTVKNQLEDLNAQYDAIDEAKDRAFGKSKLKEMDAEIAKTDELINKQKEYLREIEDYLPKDKAIMEKAYNEYIGGPGIEYDALGNISNFDAIQDAMFNKYNSMASAYTDDSDEWKEFEKKYELLEKYIEQYEETYDLLRDERDKMQELINQKIDLGLEKVQYQVEVALDVPDSEIKVLEYKLGRIDDDAAKSLEAVSLLTKQAEQVYDKIQLNKQALNDVLKLSMSAGEIAQILAGDMSVLAGKTFTEDQIDAVKEYRDALIDLNGEFDDLRDSVQEKVMNVFDDWRDKLNTGIETIDHYSSTLESYRNIIDIVGKDTLGITSEFMNKLAQSTVDVAIDKLKGTKKTYETIVESRDEAEKQLQAAQARNDEASIKFWQESLETINEEVRSANEEMMQAWEDALSSIADNFEKTVEDLIDKFQKSVYALGGLDGLSDDFSRRQDEADIMLDDYQKIYELSKLARDVNKTIDDTDIISGKQKLKKLLGQINDLQADGNKMSEYDLEYLQKTYDLRLAEIELEEAQRAKNTVRLQKDSEGNWSYIYTQSSDAIDSAQQKYEDALYAMQDLSSNYIDEMSEKLISTSKDMEEALAAIRIQDFASIDDYYAEVERVQKQYQEEMDMQQNELQKAIDNNKELYDTDWTNYHEATGYKISDTEDFVTSFKDSLLGTLMDSESDAANFTDIIGDSVYNLTLGLMQAAETYYKNIEDAMNAAGTSTGDFAEDASENIDKVVEKSHEGTDAVNDMADQMTSAFDSITESVGAWQENYGMAMEKIIQSNLDVVESFNNMLAAMSIDPDSITIKYDIANSAKDQKASSFDTGGYTGEWGTAGKLAVLHQKEMVLNENDTANMLAAVQFTRSILDTIDINARAASLGLGTLTAASLKEDKQQTLQQDVHITAEFPNVNDHNEIEEAFNNLINQASQYANRK